jgi:hypothetical protein
MSDFFGRPDRKGRSSRKPTSRQKKFMKLRSPFVALPVDVMTSDAYRTLPLQARRVLDCLMIEHAAHGSVNNGRLVATYDYIESRFGVSRRLIAPAIRELEKRGLVRRTAIGSGNRRTGEKAPSRYRLTFFASLPDEMQATDEWEKYEAVKRQK